MEDISFCYSRERNVLLVPKTNGRDSIALSLRGHTALHQKLEGKKVEELRRLVLNPWTTLPLYGILRYIASRMSMRMKRQPLPEDEAEEDLQNPMNPKGREL
jgi:hypothetical protein